MDDLTDIIDEVPEAPAEVEAVEQPEQVVDPAEGDPVPAVSEPEKESPTIPLAALQEVRNENKDLKRMLQEIQQQNQPKVETPDFLDPEGANFMTKQMQQMQFQMEAKLSEQTARIRHGDDAVNAALAAAQEANMVGELGVKPDAWGELVKWHAREKVVKEVGDDPAAYRKRLEAEIRQSIQAEMVVQQAQAAPSAPSLAGATSSTATPQGGFRPASLDDIL